MCKANSVQMDGALRIGETRDCIITDAEGVSGNYLITYLCQGVDGFALCRVGYDSSERCYVTMANESRTGRCTCDGCRKGGRVCKHIKAVSALLRSRKLLA